MRTHKMLPGYLLEANGTAINKETGEVEQLVSKNEYRLETAETVFLETKGYSINLVRRFTKDQLIKLYKDADVSEIPDKTKDMGQWDSEKTALKQDFVTNVSQVGQDLPKDDNKFVGQSDMGQQSGTGVYINGTKFDSIRQAAEQTGMSKSTIDRRLKSDDFPTYYKIE